MASKRPIEWHHAAAQKFAKAVNGKHEPGKDSSEVTFGKHKVIFTGRDYPVEDDEAGEPSAFKQKITLNNAALYHMGVVPKHVLSVSPDGAVNMQIHHFTDTGEMLKAVQLAQKIAAAVKTAKK